LDNKYVNALATRVFNEKNDRSVNVPRETVHLQQINGSNQSQVSSLNSEKTKDTNNKKKKRRFFRK